MLTDEVELPNCEVTIKNSGHTKVLIYFEEKTFIKCSKLQVFSHLIHNKGKQCLKVVANESTIVYTYSMWEIN